MYSGFIPCSLVLLLYQDLTGAPCIMLYSVLGTSAATYTLSFLYIVIIFTVAFHNPMTAETLLDKRRVTWSHGIVVWGLPVMLLILLLTVGFVRQNRIIDQCLLLAKTFPVWAIQAAAFGLYVPAMVVTCCLILYILNKARLMARMTSPVEVAANNMTPIETYSCGDRDNPYPTSTGRPEQLNGEKVQNQSQWKGLKIMVTCVVMMLIGWVPCIAILVTYSLCTSCFSGGAAMSLLVISYDIFSLAPVAFTLDGYKKNVSCSSAGNMQS